MTPALAIHCERLHAKLSPAACGLRYLTACQRFAPVYAHACLGCDVGAGNVGLLPASALTRRRTAQDAYRAYETARAPKRRAELRPDRVQR